MKTVTIRDSFKKRSNKKITYNEYKEILEGFFKLIAEQIFEGNIVRISKFGTLQVLGKRIDLKVDEQTGEIVGLAPDWISTNKLWKENEEARKEKRMIYFLNEHTNYIRYRVFWSKKSIFAENKNFYSFKFSRTNKRLLNKLIEQGKEYYILN